MVQNLRDIVFKLESTISITVQMHGDCMKTLMKRGQFCLSANPQVWVDHAEWKCKAYKNLS